MHHGGVKLPETILFQLLLKKMPLFLPFMTVEDFISLFLSTKRLNQSLEHYIEIWIYPIFKMSLQRSYEIQSQMWFKRLFKKLMEIVPQDLREHLQADMKITKNLIKNKNGEKGFSHWTKLKSGGDGWMVTKGWKHLRSNSSFSGSYAPCEMYQDVDITVLKKERPVIFVGSCLSRRSDCGAEAMVTAILYNEAGNALLTKSTAVKDELVDGRWRILYHIFGSKAEEQELVLIATKVRLVLWTKDVRFWAGHYAARFADSFVRVIPQRLLPFD